MLLKTPEANSSALSAAEEAKEIIKSMTMKVWIQYLSHSNEGLHKTGFKYASRGLLDFIAS